MLDEGTLVIPFTLMIATIGWLAWKVFELSTRIDDVKRNLKLEFKVELGKAELKNKYLDETYTIRGNEYIVVDVEVGEFYISSGLSHIEYIIELVDTNGFRISLNHNQFEYFIEEMENENSDKDNEQEVDQ